MRRFGLALLIAAGFGGPALAQEPWMGMGPGPYGGQQPYVGNSSFGAQETLFRFDNQEPWKHGWRKQMPYHEGFHSFRPYNYHHVFGQTQAAAAYGQQMPYSQQWWHRYHSVSAQYNHLQGQPPMAIPQYNGPPGPASDSAAPQNSAVTPPPAGSYMPPQPNPYGAPQGMYAAPGSYPAPPGSYEMPPAPMNIDPAYAQPGARMDSLSIPAMPTPLMPVQ